MDDDDVPFAQGHVVHLQSRLDVGGGDEGAPVEAGLAAGRVGLELAGRLEDLHHVEHHAAGREGLQVLESEAGHVVLVDELPHCVLVVVAILPPDMAHAVEMGAHMALAEPGILHVGELVLAVRSARSQAGGGQDGLGEAAPEERDTVHQWV